MQNSCRSTDTRVCVLHWDDAWIREAVSIRIVFKRASWYIGYTSFEQLNGKNKGLKKTSSSVFLSQSFVFLFFFQLSCSKLILPFWSVVAENGSSQFLKWMFLPLFVVGQMRNMHAVVQPSYGPPVRPLPADLGGGLASCQRDTFVLSRSWWFRLHHTLWTGAIATCVTRSSLFKSTLLMFF